MFRLGLTNERCGGLGVFQVYVYEPLTPSELSTFLNTVYCYLQHESIHQLHQRVRNLLGEKGHVHFDENLKDLEEVEREEWITEMLDSDLVIHFQDVEGQWLEMEYPVHDPTGEHMANRLAVDIGRVHHAW